jgi:hypothetical protein
VLQIKLDPDELEAVSRVATQAFLPNATWARQTLLRSAGFHPAVVVPAAATAAADARQISAESPATPGPRRDIERPRVRRMRKR